MGEKACNDVRILRVLNYRFSPGDKILWHIKRTLFSDQIDVEKKCVIKSCHENEGLKPACYKLYEREREREREREGLLIQ